MLLGKRPRPPIKRTTSMTGITVGDDSDVEPVLPSQSFLAMVSPRSNHSHDPAHQPAHFLTSCGLCRRRLAPGRDIYMYRGDAAFCSLECRERQMKQDEKKEKLSLMSNHHHHQQQQQQEENNNNNNKNASTKSHTIVAA